MSRARASIGAIRRNGRSLSMSGDVSRTILLKKGGSEDQVEVIGAGAISIIVEAHTVAALLPQSLIVSSLLVITSRLHVRRAQVIFDRVVASAFPAHIVTVGSPYDGFITDQ